MKKLFIIFPVVVLMFLLVTGFVNAESIRTGKITGNSVNVRSGPDVSSKVITQYSKGEKVNILAIEGDWYKISLDKSEGWVSSRYIAADEDPTESGVISSDGVNVRTGPDISSEVITKFSKGTKVSIFTRSDDWYKIWISGVGYGWVSKSWVTVRQESVSRGTDLRRQIVDYANRFLGVRYVYGGTSPNGFDCSGFAQYVFKHFGIGLERTAADQGQHGSKVSRSELLPGDLVFFDTNGGLNAIEHVGIYIGGGKFIHASSGSNYHVIISDLTGGFYDDSYMRSRDYIGE